MAARDQALFLETYLGLRRTLKRKSYDSDSDSEIDQSTNRGNKLKRRARFVREGQLVPADGSNVYAETIDYNGYQREIVSHNPPVVDDDGYEIDESEEDEDDIHEAVANAAEKNPYSSIHLEHLLAPLTSVTDLPGHPTLSQPYKSKVLAELATQGRNWMHKENKALWKVKPLLTKLSGDHIWVDCKLMSTPDDIKLFDDQFVGRLFGSHDIPKEGPLRAEDIPKLLTEEAEQEEQEEKAAGNTPKTNGQASKDTEMPDATDNDSKPEGKPTARKTANGQQKQDKQQNGEASSSTGGGGLHGAKGAAGDASESRGATATNTGTNGTTGTDGNGASSYDTGYPYGYDYSPGADNGVLPFPEPDENDATGDGFGGFIHPLYLAPRAARPYPNVGLPDQEAEDVRRLLQLWVQKQEEVARGTRKLQEGLLKANRLRKTVWMWSKAEASKDLSDGEDFYDKETWGLKEDLKKGHDEEEEEQVPVKKTRNRK